MKKASNGREFASFDSRVNASSACADAVSETLAGSLPPSRQPVNFADRAADQACRLERSPLSWRLGNPLPLRELAEFRATIPRRPAAELLREERDEV